MSSVLLLDTLRLLGALYLIVLSLAALLGVHRTLMAYPFHAGYATVRLLVLVATLGRVRLSEDARRVQRRHQRRLRELGSSVAEWRERRDEERAVARGEDPYAPAGGWATAREPDQGPAAPPAVTPAASAPGPPEPAPLPPAPVAAPAAGVPEPVPAAALVPPEDDDAPPSLW